MPRDRTEVQDHATAGRLHARRNGLGAEKLVAQVDGDAVVPVLRRDVLDFVAVIVGRVVDHDFDGAVIAFDLREHLRQRVQVGQVAMEELGRMPGTLQAFGQLLRCIDRDVNEEHLRALSREGFDHRGADAGTAACEQHALFGKAGIDRIDHRLLLVRQNLRHRVYLRLSR